MTRAYRPRLGMLVVSLIILAFIAGASCGIVGYRLMMPTLRIRAPGDAMSDVLDRLGLTPAQRAQADSIVSRTAPRSRTVMLELAERLRLVADSVDRELREVLTPEQARRLDSLGHGPRFLLKLRADTPGGRAVDTLLDSHAESSDRP